LNERSRRLFAASEAKAAGHGGILAVSEVTGVARSTIGRGLRELSSGRDANTGRLRRRGGGRKTVASQQPALAATLLKLVDDAIRGDPESPLRWLSRSQRRLARELVSEGFNVSHKLVGRLLNQLGFSLQANAKTREGASHPDRDAQFRYINATSQARLAAGEPVISVDCKKKELVGDFKNAGREWRRKGDPKKVRTHDFEDKELGKAVPYGVYDIANNVGWVSVGVDHETGAFAVETIRRWWQRLGQTRFAANKRLMITADAGGSNGWRRRLWKVELQRFADETGLTIDVSHFPPGTSKWNRIEHRLFACISQNWHAKPLVSLQVIVSLIAATKTETGLCVHCDLDQNEYPTGIKIPKSAMRAINLTPHAFHGEWNYTISPRPP
jgi:Rhodopirellula transposase DDE domain